VQLAATDAIGGATTRPRFKLRQDMKSHNGEPFNSAAIICAIKRINAPAAVQRWGYQTWAVGSAGSPDRDGGTVRAIDGQALESPRSFSAALREAGANGWELVAVDTSPNWTAYTFKRPKE
jgi:ABC-type transport system substrate-binding protein